MVCCRHATVTDRFHLLLKRTLSLRPSTAVRLTLSCWTVEHLHNLSRNMYLNAKYKELFVKLVDCWVGQKSNICYNSNWNRMMF